MALAKDNTSAGAALEQNTHNNENENFSRETAVSEHGNEDTEKKTSKKSLRFFAIIAALTLSGLVTSLEATITSTALPTITADLKGAGLYTWVVNGFYLTQYVLPLPDIPLLF